MSEGLVRLEHLTEQEQEWLSRWRDKEGQPAEERVALLREEAVPVEVLGGGHHSLVDGGRAGA